MALIQANYNFIPTRNISVVHGTLYMFPFHVIETVPLQTLNILFTQGNSAKSVTFSLGIYSLTGGTLSIANSLGETVSNLSNVRWFPRFTATSAAQTLTQGNWFLGFLMSTSSNSNISLRGGFSHLPINAFPGGFIGGAFTASTDALPASLATSDFDTTGNSEMGTPIIIICGT